MSLCFVMALGCLAVIALIAVLCCFGLGPDTWHQSDPPTIIYALFWMACLFFVSGIGIMVAQGRTQ